MKVIAIYDLEDNLMTILEGYKEVAKYFNTSEGVIKTHMCLKRQDKHRRKRFNGKWYKLEEVDMDFWSDDLKEANTRIDKAIEIIQNDTTLNPPRQRERLISILRGGNNEK